MRFIIKIRNMRSRGETCWRLLKTNLLVILTLIAVGIGFAVGFGVRDLHPSKDAKMWLGMVGELYLRMLKMMIVPLIITSILAGTASMDPKSNGKISAVSLSYLIVTNCLSTIIGSILVILIKPGTTVSESPETQNVVASPMETQDIFADLLRNIIPENIVTAMFEQAETQYKTIEEKINVTSQNKTEEVVREKLTEKFVGSAPSSNILGLVIISMLFGIASSTMKEVGKPFLDFFCSTSEIILQILRWLIWSMPFGVISLIAKTIVTAEDIEGDFKKLGMYFVTVMAAMVICAVVIPSIIYSITIRKNPFSFMFSLLQAAMIAFATSSTAIAIPESLKSLEDKNGIDKRVTRYVVPLFSALGRSGSAVYITVSCLFIVQMLNIEVDRTKIILVCVLTTISSLAIPSMAGPSLVAVIILLTALNIPAEAVSLLHATYWFLDRAETVCNFYVQMFGVVLTFQVCKTNLKNENGIVKENTESKIDANSKKPIENGEVKAPPAYTNVGYEDESTKV